MCAIMVAGLYKIVKNTFEKHKNAEETQLHAARTQSERIQVHGRDDGGIRIMELTTRRQTLEKEKAAHRLLLAAGMAAACFLISRACFMENMLPAGAALIVAMVSLNAMNIYLFPFMLLGMYSNGTFLWGDVAALCGCGFIFLCAGRIRFATWHRAVIAGAIIIISQSVSCIAAGAAYPLSAMNLVVEGGIGMVLCGIFDTFLRMIKGESLHGGAEVGLLSLSTVIMLAVSGLGVPLLLLPAAMIITLFSGYFMGIMEGLLAAFVTGFLISLFEGSPGVGSLLMLGGITAGLLCGQSKLAAGLCFAVVTIGAESLEAFSGFSVPYYGSVMAGGLMVLIPRKWLMRLDGALSVFLKSQDSEEKKNSMRASEKLQELRKTFDNLSALFVSQDNRRILMSYQFRVMSRVLEQTMKSMSRKALSTPAKYQMEPAWASYAKNQEVSGDSYLWAQLPGDRFAVILSDGMGNGKVAAAESSLTVTTIIRLLETGLEVELVLKLLNQIMLLNAENEVFSTIDLGIFNQKTGRMRFYKIGAAATFIKRKRTVDALTLSAMPMGIVDGLKVDCVTTSLKPGDQVIMVSDGVTDSRREDLSMEWLKETIADIRSKDPQTMCDLIMNQAVENYREKEKDDLTVLAMRVS